jgi:hypothetical protein
MVEAEILFDVVGRERGGQRGKAVWEGAAEW